MPVKPIDAEHVKLIDELGALDAELSLVSSKIARQKALRGIMRDWFVDEPADKAIVANGSKFTVIVGPKGNERFIPNMAALFARLGKSKFLAVADIALGKLDELLAPIELGKFLDSAQTGPRSVKTTIKQAKAA